MKTLMKLFVLLIGALSTSVVLASASGNLKVTMEKADNEVTTVEISGISLSKVEIEFRNSYGEKLYTMETAAAANAFKKKYDFSGLKDGTYWYSVKMDKDYEKNGSNRW
jgi:hypothetical protein